MNKELGELTVRDRVRYLGGLVFEEVSRKIKKESDLEVLKGLHLHYYQQDKDKFRKLVENRLKDFGIIINY